MTVRITKARVAMAALFVLAGVGLGSLLSPLGGSALATAGQIVNVSDPTLANSAHVDGTGALKVAGAVTVPVLPAAPWSNEAQINTNTQQALLASQVGTKRLVVTSLQLTSDWFGGAVKERVIFEMYRSPTGVTSCASYGGYPGWTPAGFKMTALANPTSSTDLTFPTGWAPKGSSASNQILCLYVTVLFPDDTYRLVFVQGTGFVQ